MAVEKLEKTIALVVDTKFDMKRHTRIY